MSDLPKLVCGKCICIKLTITPTLPSPIKGEEQSVETHRKILLQRFHILYKIFPDLTIHHPGDILLLEGSLL